MKTAVLRCLVIAVGLIVTTTAAWATFSIVAVDPETGEVGSAGASCITGVIAISDVAQQRRPVRGARHRALRPGV